MSGRVQSVGFAPASPMPYSTCRDTPREFQSEAFTREHPLLHLKVSKLDAESEFVAKKSKKSQKNKRKGAQMEIGVKFEHLTVNWNHLTLGSILDMVHGLSGPKQPESLEITDGAAAEDAAAADVASASEVELEPKQQEANGTTTTVEASLGSVTLCLNREQHEEVLAVAEISSLIVNLGMKGGGMEVLVKCICLCFVLSQIVGETGTWGSHTQN